MAGQRDNLKGHSLGLAIGRGGYCVCVMYPLQAFVVYRDHYARYCSAVDAVFCETMTVFSA